MGYLILFPSQLVGGTERGKGQREEGTEIEREREIENSFRNMAEA